MDADEIRRLILWLQGRVSFQKSGRAIVIKFDEPGSDDFKEAGFGNKIIKSTLEADWWPEMVKDIIETSDFAGPEETSEQIFKYARDVVREYINKRIL